MNFKLLILYYLLAFKVNRLIYGNNWAELRKKRFKQFLKRLKNSPFYRLYLQSSNVLTDFPVITKKVFMEHFDEINTRHIKKEEAVKLALEAEATRNFTPMIGDITVGLSSGTSGSRGIFLASNKERARWVACVLDRVIGFSLNKRKVAFFLRANSNLYSSVQSSLLKFHFFDLINPIPENICQLNHLQPDILVAQPSMLIEIAHAIENKSIDISPIKIISVAEVLTPEDKKYLQAVFNQIIHQAYQCTEGFLAYTCEEGTLHFNEDILIIEQKFLDQNKHRFHPIITDLVRTTQPVLRYELDDIITAKKSCPCGSKWLAIDQIEGRSDDMLVFKNIIQEEVKIFPDFFRRAIISASPDIEDYAVIQKSPNLLHVYIKAKQVASSKAALQAIQSLLTDYHIEHVTLNQVIENEHRFGNKLRRIKNDTPQTR